MLRLHNPPALATPRGYSVVGEVAPGGTTIYIAGQLAQDTAGAIVGTTAAEQAEAVFANLAAALEAAHATFADVVKLNMYLLDVAALGAVREVRDRYVNRERPPVSTAVVVAALAVPGYLLEIEATAVVYAKAGAVIP